MKIRSVIKCPGNKNIIKNWILKHFPEDYTNMTYCEPFVGGGSVYLNKLPSKEEVISDINYEVLCIYKALRDEPTEIIGRLKRVKHSEKTFKRAKSKSINDYIDLAVNELVLRKMSSHEHKQVFTQEYDWNKFIKELGFAANRVKHTHILCENALKIIQVWDGPNTFMYIDPPRIEETTDLANNAMSVDEHIQLAETINSAKSFIVISGYPSTLFNRLYKDWNCVRYSNKRQKNKDKKIDCLWLNY